MRKPVWIEERVALVIHERLLALHGGRAGLRDRGLLQSALARPRHLHAYAESAGIVEMAAACSAGIIRNHPFVDGNKRTGFLIGILFLELNGYCFTAGEESSTQAVFALAERTLDESGYVAFLRENTAPMAVPKKPLRDH